MKNFMKIPVLIVSAAALFSVACGGGSSATDTTTAASAADYEGAIASSDVAHGQEVYEGVCNACHAGGAPPLENIGWGVARMRQQIREGSGGMPAMPASRLSDDDMEAALAYMATIGAVAQ